ncbi:MAG: hypothetical protein HGA38_02320 [Candidatus Moranbacteria bacterium]|nr:hypothetical protein [Candidatus Moranbacteria bacterium]
MVHRTGRGGAADTGSDVIGIGIENGIIRFGGVDGRRFPIDIAIIVLLLPDGREYVSVSEGMRFPEACVAEAEKRGFGTTTVGSVFSERFGGDPTDPHTVMSGGRVSRRKILTEGLKQVFYEAFQRGF